MPERRVTKAEAERLTAALAADDAVVLRCALASVLVRLSESVADWPALVANSAAIGAWAVGRAEAVAAEDPAALEQLAVDLNELRSLRVDD